jgi:hypothetical protein
VPDITPMRTLHLSLRWSARSTPPAPSRLRVEVCPPSLRQPPASAWQRLLFWLLAPAPLDVAPPLSRLPAVQADFRACLADVPTADAQSLLERIRLGRTLRELWHLRTEVYRVVAVHHSQREAESRLLELNRHFPTRAPRSAFAPL